jgi:hypothetical protein
VEALFGDVARRARYARPDQLLESSLGVPYVVVLHPNEIGLGGGFHFDPFPLRILAQDVQSRPLKSVTELRILHCRHPSNV